MCLTKYNEKKTRQAFPRMIIVDELSFLMVEGRGFWNLLKVIEPKFPMPSLCLPYAMMRDYVKLFIGKRGDLMNFFASKEIKAYFTTDTWTSVENMNYIYVAGHFIDSNWTLHKRIILLRKVWDHKRQQLERN